MKYPYPTTSANGTCGDETISNRNVSLPINCPIPVWPINCPIPQRPIIYPTLVWPHDHPNSYSVLTDSTSTWSVNITDEILSRRANQVVCPFYASDLTPFLRSRVLADPLDLALDKPSDHSSEQARSDSLVHHHDLIVSVLSEQIVKQNIVTDVKMTEDMITIYISPVISATYAGSDCQNPTTVNFYDSDPITVQGLGIQGKAVRYVVDMVRLRYINDAMRFKVLPKAVDVPGIRSNIKVTDEVLEMSMYFIIDRNLPLSVTADVLADLYRVETSSSALDRWKVKEADALPSIGQLIQQLNAKKAITQLHLDEYKAKGTKSWELSPKGTRSAVC